MITKRGKSVARLIPEVEDSDGKVDWSKSVAMRDRTGERTMTKEQLKELWDHLDG